PPLEQTLRMLKKLGYAQVEGYGGIYDDLESLQSGLSETGLAMTSGHFGLDMIENEPARAVEIARGLGMKAVYCPYLPAEERPADATGYARFGERLQKAGEPLIKAGFIFGWHNHDFE